MSLLASFPHYAAFELSLIRLTSLLRPVLLVNFWWGGGQINIVYQNSQAVCLSACAPDTLHHLRSPLRGPYFRRPAWIESHHLRTPCFWWWLPKEMGFTGEKKRPSFNTLSRNPFYHAYHEHIHGFLFYYLKNKGFTVQRKREAESKRAKAGWREKNRDRPVRTSVGRSSVSSPLSMYYYY